MRYADDSNVYVRSQRAGLRVMEGLMAFLIRKLKLKVNVSKSAVAQPGQRKFLGFSFTGGGKARRRIAPKAILRFKERIRELTRRTRGTSIERMTKEFRRYLNGWLGYFGFCETPSVLRGLEGWMRRRLHCFLWKQWKHSRTRFPPSWQSDGAFGRGAQSEAALAACGRRPKADGGSADGKAAVRDGMTVVGGGHGR